MDSYAEGERVIVFASSLTATDGNGVHARAEWIECELPLEIAGEEAGTIAQIFVADPAGHPPLALLLADESADFRVNGVPALAATVLKDGDEVRTTDGRIFLFAAYRGTPRSGVAHETLAQNCPVCGRPIRESERWTTCPACPAVMHAEPMMQPDGTRKGPSCAEYDVRCRACDRTWASMCWHPSERGYE